MTYGAYHRRGTEVSLGSSRGGETSSVDDVPRRESRCRVDESSAVLICDRDVRKESIGVYTRVSVDDRRMKRGYSPIQRQERRNDPSKLWTPMMLYNSQSVWSSLVDYRTHLNMAMAKTRNSATLTS
jgi:hypothetical protein